MKRTLTFVATLTGAVASIAVATLLSSCATSGSTEVSAASTTPVASASATASSAPATSHSDKTASTGPNAMGGAQLWAENCGHCHNIRSPSAYSDSQWEVVALHMRIRANLTAAEHKKILAFLKSAH